MLTTAEVMAELGNWLSPGELAEVLKKLLRVPEAWVYIHNPEVLDQILDANVEENLLPASLAEKVLEPSNSAEPVEMDEDLESQLRTLWNESSQLPVATRDFEDVAILANKLRHSITSPLHPDIISQLILDAKTWISPLACTWSNLEDGNAVLQALIAESSEIGLFLSVNVLLANYSHVEALPHLLNASQIVARHELFNFLSSYKPTFLECFSKLDKETQVIKAVTPSQASPDMHLSLSILAHSLDEDDLATVHVEQATEMNSELRASLEDQKATLFTASGSSELALEAHHQALALQNTSKRRAELSLFHSQQENLAEALQVLPTEPQTFLEMVATSTALLKEDELERGRKYLQLAVNEAQRSPRTNYSWTTQLIELLKEDGDIVSAIKIAKVRASNFPGSSDALTKLAIILNDAGDASSASEYACLAFAISPDSTLTRQTLAISLQNSGNPIEALAHWTTLADENPQALSHVAQCALEAGFTELAVAMARNFIEHEPQSATGHVLLGRALSANDKIENSLEILEMATQEFPDHANSWIALSECQDKSDDPDSAGHTLATAIQLIPDNPELLHSYSIWLEQCGRHSEAVEAAERAYQAESKNYKYQVAYGDLLRELGHFNEALPILESAVGQKPFQWKGLLAIAKTHEGLQDISSAYQSTFCLPVSVPADVHLYAAKIALRLAQENDDANVIRSGKLHLAQANAKDLADPTIHYLQGLLDELEGNYPEAMESYQASAKSFIHKDPEYYLDSKLGMARTSLAMDQIPDATSILEEARLRYPSSIKVLSLLSKTYLESGNEIEALKTIERALKIEPSNRYALKQIAQISSQLKTWAPAMHAFKKSVDLDPENPKAWIDFAENALTVGNIAKSRKAVSHALLLNRQDPQVLANTAKVMHKMKRPQSARRLLQRAISRDNDSIPLLRQLAMMAEESAEHEIALQAWIRVSEIEPHDKEALLKTAQAYWATNQQSSAIKVWERILKVDPEDISTLNALANAYMAQGTVEEGLALFDKVLQANPENVEIALQAAQVALDVHDVEMAFNVLSDILRYAPKDTDVLLALADCLIHRNQPDKALEVLDSVIVDDAFPMRWFALVTITSAMLGDLQRAQASFEQAREISPINDWDILLFSKAAITINRWSDALNILTSDDGDIEIPARILAEAHLQLRASEVNFIYEEAQAHSHAPLTVIRAENNVGEIKHLLSRASHFPINKATYDHLTYRFNLLNCQDDPSALLENRSYAQQDKTGETLEAMALSRLRMDQPQIALELIALRDDYGLDGDLFDLIVGICQNKLGRFELARDVFQVAQEKSTFKPLAQYFEAQTLFEDNRIDEKKTLLNAAIILWPDEHAWQYQLGAMYQDENDLNSALPHLQQAAELAPTNDQYNLALARVLRDTGHLSQGYARLNLAVKNAPSDAQIRYDAGSLALAIGDAEGAANHFDQACSLSPSDPACLVGSARAAMSLGNSKDAMAKIRSALRISPDDTDTLIAAGEIFAKQGNFDKAISSYDLALSKASDPLPVHLAKIKLLSQVGRVQDAIEQSSKFVEEYPQDERVWAAHAEACEASMDLQKAQESVSKAVKLAPNNITYRLILGRLSRKAGQLDRALDELSRLERMEPTNSHILVELGQLFEDRRQFSEALETYQRAISCDTDFTTAYYRAGLVLKNLKSYPEAGVMLSKAAELDPNNPDTHHQLAAVRALELVHGGISQAVVSI